MTGARSLRLNQLLISEHLNGARRTSLSFHQMLHISNFTSYVEKTTVRRIFCIWWDNEYNSGLQPVCKLQFWPNFMRGRHFVLPSHFVLHSDSTLEIGEYYTHLSLGWPLIKSEFVQCRKPTHVVIFIAFFRPCKNRHAKFQELPHCRVLLG